MACFGLTFKKKDGEGGGIRGWIIKGKKMRRLGLGLGKVSKELRGKKEENKILRGD